MIGLTKKELLTKDIAEDFTNYMDYHNKSNINLFSPQGVILLQTFVLTKTAEMIEANNEKLEKDLINFGVIHPE